MRVPYGYLTREFESLDLSSFNEVVRSGDLTLGRATGEFEKQLADYVGSSHALAVGNGTDALEMALHCVAQETDKGQDEVIVPVNTFIASVAAIVREGLRPVFCDVNEKFVMDVDDMKNRITERTVAIMPVHFQGQPCDMSSIMEFAKSKNIYVVEDAAQALDASLGGKSCGTIGDFGCFSFHPQKNLNCLGDGGAIVTNNPYFYEYLDKYRNHGMSSRDTYDFFGRNSRMDTINSLYLQRRLPTLSLWNDQRIRVAKSYDNAFKETDVPIITPPRSPAERHTYHLYMMRVECRDQLYSYLNERGVDAKIHYPIPLHLQKCSDWMSHKEGDFPAAEQYAKEMISLPIHQFMTTDETNYVIDCVRGFYGV